LCGAVLVVAMFVVAGWLRRWTVDDAFIVFRVVDQVLAGHGVVFNAGERVEAVTSPLWLAILVAASVVPAPVEWLAVVLGLALAAAGVGCAMAGAWALAGSDRRLVPAGVLVWLGLPPAWDYATSGLESGLGIAWLGACWWTLARAATRPPVGTRGRGVGVTLGVVLVGLGPVIRPDFGVFAAVFGVALLACAARGWRLRLGMAAAMALVPGAVEVARMGYYAALVPNTLLAKEASMANWAQGWLYLRDFATPYWLAVPLVVVVWRVLQAAHADRGRRRRVARLAPALAGLLYVVLVVRGGGDFMHARLLLPALFAVLAPVALVRTRTLLDAGAVAVLAGWALVCAATLRAPTGPPERGHNTGISDQRTFYVGKAGLPNPVTLDDYAAYGRVTNGADAARLAAAGRRALVLDEQVHPLAPDAAPTTVYETGAVGLAGAAAGPDVYVLDRLGLGDAFGARQRLVERRRPGHEKPLLIAWVRGRYGVMIEVPPDQAAAARAARTAMSCPPLRELDAAISEPLTAQRVLANIAAAPHLTALRYPGDPQAAARELCGVAISTRTGRPMGR